MVRYGARLLGLRSPEATYRSTAAPRDPVYWTLMQADPVSPGLSPLAVNIAPAALASARVTVPAAHWLLSLVVRP